jgi:threonine/homoserine/homoserine lactone efflux protein
VNNFWLTVLFLIGVAVFVWIVAQVFRGGAPTGESSSRADTFASGLGYGADELDTLRSRQAKHKS